MVLPVAWYGDQLAASSFQIASLYLQNSLVACCRQVHVGSPFLASLCWIAGFISTFFTRPRRLSCSFLRPLVPHRALAICFNFHLALVNRAARFVISLLCAYIFGSKFAIPYFPSSWFVFFGQEWIRSLHCRSPISDPVFAYSFSPIFPSFLIQFQTKLGNLLRSLHYANIWSISWTCTLVFLCASLDITLILIEWSSQLQVHRSIRYVDRGASDHVQRCSQNPQSFSSFSDFRYLCHHSSIHDCLSAMNFWQFGIAMHDGVVQYLVISSCRSRSHSYWSCSYMFNLGELFM